MTIPKEVQEAVECLRITLNDWTATYAGELCYAQAVCDADNRIRKASGTLSYICNAMSAVDTVKSHLLSQDAEIARKEQEWHEMFDRALLAESRLAASNALLRESLPRIGSECAERHIADLVERIQSHLQGAGDEA